MEVIFHNHFHPKKKKQKIRIIIYLLVEEECEGSN